MKKSEWDKKMGKAILGDIVYMPTGLYHIFWAYIPLLSNWLVEQGWLPPARTEHGITKNDWEPEDE